MDLKITLCSQYLASLEMAKQAILKCPESLWNHKDYKNKTWHLAYHALFYTHLYLHQTENDFKPWPKHRPEYNFMGALPWPPHDPPKIGEPYTKAELLEYCAFLEKQAPSLIDVLDLGAGSGFDWLPFSKLELQFYNIRHIMQHTGELCERMGEQAGVEVDWVGTKRS